MDGFDAEQQELIRSLLKKRDELMRIQEAIHRLQAMDMVPRLEPAPVPDEPEEKEEYDKDEEDEDDDDDDDEDDDDDDDEEEEEEEEKSSSSEEAEQQNSSQFEAAVYAVTTCVFQCRQLSRKLFF